MAGVIDPLQKLQWLEFSEPLMQVQRPQEVREPRRRLPYPRSKRPRYPVSHARVLDGQQHPYDDDCGAPRHQAAGRGSLPVGAEPPQGDDREHGEDCHAAIVPSLQDRINRFPLPG